VSQTRALLHPVKSPLPSSESSFGTKGATPPRGAAPQHRRRRRRLAARAGPHRRLSVGAGGMDAPRLRRAPERERRSRIRERDDVNGYISNVTTRVVPCRFARRFAAPRHHGPGLRRGSLLPLPGMALPRRGLPHPARLRGRLALHAQRRSRGALPVRRRRLTKAVHAAEDPRVAGHTRASGTARGGVIPTL
jgi:hypothetical protein